MVPGRDTLFTNNTCLRVYKSTPVQGLQRLQILFLYHLSQYVRLRAWTKERWNLWTYVIRDNCFRLSISYLYTVVSVAFLFLFSPYLLFSRDSFFLDFDIATLKPKKQSCLVVWRLNPAAQAQYACRREHKCK